MREISILEELKLFLEAEEDVNVDVQADIDVPTSPRLKLDVNPNPTKKGVKVQFILPKGYSTGQKEELTQKLKTKLTQGLSQYNLTVSQDTDVPYSNVIGFLIPIADFKLFIKNAIGGGSVPETPPPAV